MITAAQVAVLATLAATVPHLASSLPATSFIDNRGPSQCPKGDRFCETHIGPASYCKYWQQGPGGSVCQGSTLPCQCSGCKGDAFCQGKVGPSSYCKYWQKGAGKVCQYSDIPCDCK